MQDPVESSAACHLERVTCLEPIWGKFHANAACYDAGIMLCEARCAMKAYGYLPVLLGLVLSACASDKEREAQLAAADDGRCKSYGLQFGTSEYAQCRMGVDQQRTSLRAAYIAAQPRQTRCETSDGEINCKSY
jgi:hypothetical protein